MPLTAEEQARETLVTNVASDPTLAIDNAFPLFVFGRMYKRIVNLMDAVQNQATTNQSFQNRLEELEKNSLLFVARLENLEAENLLFKQRLDDLDAQILLINQRLDVLENPL